MRPTTGLPLPAPPPPHTDVDTVVPVLGAQLAARLVKPPQPPHAAVVVGVLGTGTRTTSANRFVADTFARAGLAVLVVELLTEEEDARADAAHADLPLLAERLADAAEWLAFNTGVLESGVALVGVGPAGAAAMVAAAAEPDLARAVVCASTQLDRAGAAAVLSETPTLVLVGDQDLKALTGCDLIVPCMRCEHRLEVIRGAGPRFEEPGALDAVMGLATAWLRERLVAPGLAAN